MNIMEEEVLQDIVRYYSILNSINRKTKITSENITNEIKDYLKLFIIESCKVLDNSKNQKSFQNIPEIISFRNNEEEYYLLLKTFRDKYIAHLDKDLQQIEDYITKNLDFTKKSLEFYLIIKKVLENNNAKYKY